MTTTNTQINNMIAEIAPNTPDLYRVSEEIESNPWEKRAAYPLVRVLDRLFSETEDKSIVLEDLGVNPEAYRIEQDAVAVLECPDERLRRAKMSMIFNQLQGKHIRLVRIPGSRLGFSTDGMREMVDRLKEQGAAKVYATSHQNCGAAALEVKNHPDWGDDDADGFAEEVVKKLERKGCGLEYLGFITADDVPALMHPHDGLCLLVDGTGERNQLSDGQLPDEQFVLTRTVYPDPEILVNHIKILTSIPLGRHGIGQAHDGHEGFSRQNPFYIFVSARNEEDLKKYVAETEEAITSLPDVVRIVGFVVPKVEN